jgi:hypothetical protein
MSRHLEGLGKDVVIIYCSLPPNIKLAMASKVTQVARYVMKSDGCSVALRCVLHKSEKPDGHLHKREKPYVDPHQSGADLQHCLRIRIQIQDVKKCPQKNVDYRRNFMCCL